MTFTHTSAKRTSTSATRSLASALRDLREAQGHTIYAVCKRTGLARTVVENAEVDATSTKFGVLVVLAEFYGLPTTTDLIALGETRSTPAAA